MTAKLCVWAATLLLAAVRVQAGLYCADSRYQLYPNGKCYFTYPTAVHESTAKSTCTLDGASLPVVHSADDNYQLTTLALQMGSPVWLALSCPSDRDCVWADGSLFDYNNFLNGAPDTTAGHCVFLNLVSGSRGKWRSSDCTFDTKAVVCEMEPVGAACPFAQGPEGRCYQLVSQAQSFVEAERFCQGSMGGGHLVSLADAAQNAFVQRLANASGLDNVWLGLQFGFNYTWSDGSPWLYQNWEAGFPNTNAGTCVFMQTTSLFAGQWRNLFCATALPFVCVARNYHPAPASTPAPTSPPTSPAGACPLDDVFQNEGHLTSPGYPHYYGDAFQCTYFILAPQNSFAGVAFEDFDLKDTDYLDIFEGPGYAQLLTRLRGDVPLGHFYVSAAGNGLKLVFVSKYGNTLNRGWRATYAPFSNPATGPPTQPSPFPSNPPFSPIPSNKCPSANFYYNRTFTSPGWPNSYGANLDCAYQLQVPIGFVVQLTFGEIKTEACCDVIFVFDGPDENAKLLGTVSGEHAPGTVGFRSSDRFLTLRFVTDSLVEEKGFIATFGPFQLRTTSPPPTPSSPPTPTPSQRFCQDGWIHDPQGQWCYKYFYNGMTWSQSLQACASQGTQLLTIHNGFQESNVLDLIQNAQSGQVASAVWIGLHLVDGDWEWSDGTASSFSAWLPGEPSPLGACASIRTGGVPGWFAANCNILRPYICYHTALN